MWSDPSERDEADPDARDRRLGVQPPGDHAHAPDLSASRGGGLRALPPLVTRHEVGSAPPVVVIGSSTGGPAALMQIFGAFPEPPGCAFLVAQHMPEGFTTGFAERLDRLTRFRASEARGDVELAPGTIQVAPGRSVMPSTLGCDSITSPC